LYEVQKTGRMPGYFSENSTTASFHIWESSFKKSKVSHPVVATDVASFADDSGLSLAAFVNSSEPGS
jgi:hypothetical protein